VRIQLSLLLLICSLFYYSGIFPVTHFCRLIPLTAVFLFTMRLETVRYQKLILKVMMCFSDNLQNILIFLFNNISGFIPNNLSFGNCLHAVRFIVLAGHTFIKQTKKKAKPSKHIHFLFPIYCRII
jgi:hypothetical protein